MDANVHSRLPTFAEAVGGNIYRWVAEQHILEQFLDLGFAEAAIDPRYLEVHAPKFYTGLSRIAASPNRRNYEILHERRDEFGEDMESGLMHRDDDELKDQIHVFRHMRETLIAQGVPLEEIDLLDEFFASAYEFDDAGQQVFCAIGAHCDLYNEHMPAHKRYTGSLAMRFADGKHLVRGLDYWAEADPTPKPSANVHIDRSGATLHFESTHAGLVVWDKRGTPHRMNETKRNTVLMFPSRKMAHLVKWLNTTGAVHGVLDPMRNRRVSENRKAIVAFPHCALTTEETINLRLNVYKHKPNPTDYPFPADMRVAA